RGVADVRHRRGHAGFGHHLLGERLGPFDPRGGRGWTEAGDATRPDRVGDPGDERRLRADDDEVDGELLGERGDRGTVERVDIVGGGLGHAGVAGGDVQADDIGVGAQGLDERVLATTGADDEYVHADRP